MNPDHSLEVLDSVHNTPWTRLMFFQIVVWNKSELYTAKRFLLQTSFYCKHVFTANWMPESLSGSVVWWWSYTCTLMCMLCMLVVVASGIHGPMVLKTIEYPWHIWEIYSNFLHLNKTPQATKLIIKH